MKNGSAIPEPCSNLALGETREVLDRHHADAHEPAGCVIVDGQGRNGQRLEAVPVAFRFHDLQGSGPMAGHSRSDARATRHRQAREVSEPIGLISQGFEQRHFAASEVGRTGDVEIHGVRRANGDGGCVAKRRLDRALGVDG